MHSSINRALRWVKFPYVWLRYGSPVKADETVVLFPQSATWCHSTSDIPASDGYWDIPVHAWVVETEPGTVSRLLGRYTLLSLLDLTGVVSRRSTSLQFENRLSWFMADREINKRVSVEIGGEKFLSPRTGRSGHVKFSVAYAGYASTDSELLCRLVDLPDGSSQVAGRVQLLSETGFSVISDVDDTIKLSNVTRKRELVKGLFFDEYKPAPGMAEFYHQLALGGVKFHYVSASPWQLYPSLAPFLDRYFPFGCLSQRHFYIGDESFIKFFKSSMKYKIRAVSRLLQRFPKRQFVLIGDSGEKDPEVYLEIARQFKNQVSEILIREVYSGDELAGFEHERRWARISSELQEHQSLRVFQHPSELGDFSSLFCRPVDGE